MRILLSSLLSAAAIAQTGGPPGADWPHYGGTPLSWRYSSLDRINTGNVKNLAPAWIFQTEDYAENLQSTPLVVDGTMYLITPRARVFALDAATAEPGASRGRLPSTTPGNAAATSAPRR
jgi:quinoprotein glucose dehydrogenase